MQRALSDGLLDSEQQRRQQAKQQPVQAAVAAEQQQVAAEEQQGPAPAASVATGSSSSSSSSRLAEAAGRLQPPAEWAMPGTSSAAAPAAATSSTASAAPAKAAASYGNSSNNDAGTASSSVSSAGSSPAAAKLEALLAGLKAAAEEPDIAIDPRFAAVRALLAAAPAAGTPRLNFARNLVRGLLPSRNFRRALPCLAMPCCTGVCMQTSPGPPPACSLLAPLVARGCCSAALLGGRRSRGLCP